MSFIVSIVKSSGTTQEQAFRFPVAVTAGWNSTDIEWVKNECRTTFGVVHGTICELLTSGVKVPMLSLSTIVDIHLKISLRRQVSLSSYVVNSHLLTCSVCVPTVCIIRLTDNFVVYSAFIANTGMPISFCIRRHLGLPSSAVNSHAVNLLLKALMILFVPNFS